MTAGTGNRNGRSKGKSKGKGKSVSSFGRSESFLVGARER
jgi:hypothetical protein